MPSWQKSASERLTQLTQPNKPLHNGFFWTGNHAKQHSKTAEYFKYTLKPHTLLTPENIRSDHPHSTYSHSHQVEHNGSLCPIPDC